MNKTAAIPKMLYKKKARRKPSLPSIYGRKVGSTEKHRQRIRVGRHENPSHHLLHYDLLLDTLAELSVVHEETSPHCRRAEVAERSKHLQRPAFHLLGRPGR